MLRGEELSSAYASADIFMMPSETETLGFVALEAMASGLAVVAVAAGGLVDIITKPGTTGDHAEDKLFTAHLHLHAVMLGGQKMLHAQRTIVWCRLGKSKVQCLWHGKLAEILPLHQNSAPCPWLPALMTKQSAAS